MRIYSFIIAIGMSFQLIGQTSAGFYVNHFDLILGDKNREDSLLRFAENNQFNYLTLYDVHKFYGISRNKDSMTDILLSNFILRAKTKYKIQEIGVSGESYQFFKEIIYTYNQKQNSRNSMIDIWNIEYEFWISSNYSTQGYYCMSYLQPLGYSCDSSGNFNYFLDMVSEIDSLADLQGCKTEVYFGFFDSNQARAMESTGFDRALISCYLPSNLFSNSYQYGYLRPRFNSLSLFQRKINIRPLYSSEKNFMYDMALNQPFDYPYNLLLDSLKKDSNSSLNTTWIDGYLWFNYYELPPKNISDSMCEIEGFSLLEEYTPALIDKENQKISVFVFDTQKVDHTKPLIKYSHNAKITPDTSLFQNFDTPFTYSLIAQNGKVKNWTINVIKEKHLNIYNSLNNDLEIKYKIFMEGLLIENTSILDYQIKIYESSGKSLREIKIKGNKVEYLYLTNGIYLISATDGTKFFSTKINIH